ncbi:MAG: hypothetical protein WB780_12320 [Candidatus Acidiferrales bacterium]
MRSELSEFSYGFAITAELRDRFSPMIIEAPVFPTLREEAELGWDMRFPIVGASMFVQFKVADVLTRASAAEWNFYNASYYRFPMHRLSKSDQHNRLRSLATEQPLVFYVAPRFSRLHEFNQWYVSDSVIQESAWIPLLSLPTISDDQQHHISYRTGTDVLFASPKAEPIRETFSGEGWATYMTRALEVQKKEMTIEDYSQIRTTLLGILKREIDSQSAELPTVRGEGLRVLKDIAYLSRTFFGAEFLLVHEQQR